MLAKLALVRVLRAPMDGMLGSFGPWSVGMVSLVSRRQGLEVLLVMAVLRHFSSKVYPRG